MIMDEVTIISDIHLGSPACQARTLSDFLHKISERTRLLILNGDVFDSHDFRRLDKHHWNILSLLRKASNHMRIIWIAGNHDGQAEIVSHLIGVPVMEECNFESGGKSVLVMHGHKFDKFITEHPIITWVGDSIYAILQKVDRSHYFARLAKRASKHYLRCVQIIEKEAVKYALRHGHDVVCCGHTHYAFESPLYYNSGCWTESPCTYLTVNAGNITLRVYEASPKGAGL